MLKVDVQQGDVRRFSCDVLALKYAQGFYGADSMVRHALGLPEELKLRKGQYDLVSGGGRIAAGNVLFVGTAELGLFDYGQIRLFAKASLRAIADRLPGPQRVAMTIHGMGYGLDERESFQAQLAGLADFDEATPNSGLTVTIVEFDRTRAARLKKILAETRSPLVDAQQAGAGDESDHKPRVFVAMPFLDRMKERFHFVLDPVARKAGFLCEGLHLEVYTGDILSHIKQRIETSSLIIADLTDHNPNVYLEVGYAWGMQREVLFIAEKGTTPKFDVRGALCRFYSDMIDLEKQLTTDLTALKGRVAKRPG